MKKELLLGTALVTSLGLTSVAEAVTATMSGNHKTGLKGTSVDTSGSNDTVAQVNDNNFTVSLSETTDAGTQISSSFMLMNENSTPGDLDAGFTLTFTDGSKLDLLNAGNASDSHDISVPTSAGSEGITVTTTANAPTGLDFAAASSVYGIEYHSAADFLMDGLKMSASFSGDSGAAAVDSSRVDGHFGVGATYVTTAGDSTVTIGAGYSEVENSISGTQLTSEEGGMHIGLSAVTGDLTVAVAYADGDSVEPDGTQSTQADSEYVAAGVKYVSGDLTFNVGVKSGESLDSDTIGTPGTTTDSYDETSASVSYAVASGVTAYLGFTDQDVDDEGTRVAASSGSSWYIGANMSF
jgi:hypothetical protein